ncbi:MAG: YncE family protein, partial [Halobacteria archaeon]
MPAPDDAKPGDILWLFRPGKIQIEPGVFHDSWELLDRMVVGEDGIARTSSPPYPGVKFQIAPEGMLVMAVPTVMNMAYALYSTSQKLGVRVEVDAGTGTSWHLVPGLLADMIIPLTPEFPYRLKFLVTNEEGWTTVSETNVQLQAGELREMGAMPLPPKLIHASSAPLITSAKFDFGEDPQNLRPQVVLTGERFILKETDPDAPLINGHKLGTSIDDLSVLFIVGGRDVIDEQGNKLTKGAKDIIVKGTDKLSLSNDNKTLRVVVPQDIALGTATIIVMRKASVRSAGGFVIRELESNEVIVPPELRYEFAALGSTNEVSVIDRQRFNVVPVGDGTEYIKADPAEIARIGIAKDIPYAAPRSIAVTPDGTRAYVTLENGAAISVIDAIALQEVDTIADTSGIQPISLPPGSYPFMITIHSSGQYAYVTDRISPVVYILDIDPNSKTYNQHVATLNVGFGPKGLRGLAISSDGKYLFVAAPARDLFDPSGGDTGYVHVIDVRDPSDPQYFYSIPAGPCPWGLSATDNPHYMLVTDRVDDSRGLGIISLVDSPISSDKPTFRDIIYADLRDLGLIRSDWRWRQVFGVSNAQGVTYLPANEWKDFIGEHGAYAFVTGFNRFIPDDPKHDPAAGPVLVKLSPEEGYAVAAGGNVGIIRLNLDVPWGTSDFMPRLVAATRPTANAFPDNLHLFKGDGINPNAILFAGYQGLHSVFAFNPIQMIKIIEDDPNVLTDPLKSPLTQVPIDDFHLLQPLIDIKADFRFHSEEGELVFGVPTKDPFGNEPNTFAPIMTGGIPRGLTGQPEPVGGLLPACDNPYNQIPDLNDLGLPGSSSATAFGLQSMAELHSGAFHEFHQLTSYYSLGQVHNFILHYDSLRADPRPIFHFDFKDLPSGLSDDYYVIAKFNASSGDYIQKAEGLEINEEFLEMGLEGGENFFRIPVEGGQFGAALQIDLTDGPSGPYRFDISAGIFKFNGEEFCGKYTETQAVVPVVNTIDSPFGAGWGLEGLYCLYIDEEAGSVLLANGNGGESIFYFPAEGGPGATMISPPGDHSVMKQDPVTGMYIWRLPDGTVYEFDRDGLLQVKR